VSAYCPRRGDVVWLSLDTQAGHEQAGHRPALVLSPETYNRKVGLALVCPITSQEKGYPFEVPLPPGLKVAGVVLADQIKNVDWRTRGAKLAGVVTEGIVKEVSRKVKVLVG
jgi:mRNA interferase MazF